MKKTATKGKNGFPGAKKITLTIDWDLSFDQIKERLPWIKTIGETKYNEAVKGKRGKQKIETIAIPPPSKTSINKCLKTIEEKCYESIGLLETIALGMKRLGWTNGYKVASLGFKYKLSDRSNDEFIPVRKKRGKINGFLPDHVLGMNNIHIAIKKK